ncbi:MAG: hypothetical protein AB8B85_00495 [Paracoccaceae bacterium]
MAKVAKQVMGVHAPAPRVTGAAVWLALRYVGLPLLVALIALDVVIWLVAEAVWGVCIGLWCWF